MIAALVLAGCSPAASSTGGGAAGPICSGKCDGDSADNRLVVTGSVDRTLELERAFQCEISQFNVIASFRVTNDTSFELAIFRIALNLGVRVTPPVEGERFSFGGSPNRVAFDGVGYSSQGAGGCDAVVTGFANDTERASIVLTFEGCALAAGERRIDLTGEVGCAGTGYTPIDLGFLDDAGSPAPDAGLAVPDGAAPDGGDPGPDASPAEPDAGPPPDPCASACSADEACVAASCVLRSGQTQSSSCYSPTSRCDAGEDADCADGHACVDGLCRRLTCQTQSSGCYTPTAPCAEDSECASEHACVSGLCRRLSCQTQSTGCYTPTAPCEGSDDSDCASGHVCVESVCRRLSCQTQSSSCYTPTARCAEDADCASGHVCTDSICHRSSCG
jgi:hypothetical protein